MDDYQDSAEIARKEMLMRVATNFVDANAAVELGKLIFQRDPGEALRLWGQAVQHGELKGVWWTGLACEWAGDLEGAARWYRLAMRSEDRQTRGWADQALARVSRGRQKAASPAPRGPAGGAAVGTHQAFDDPGRIPAPADQPNVPPADIHQTKVPTVALARGGTA